MGTDSTEEIARRHGHEGSTACQNCGTFENVHFGHWFDPKTKESGDFLQCCSCGIKEGDSPGNHVYCGSPAIQLVPNKHGGPDSERAYEHIQTRAVKAYQRGQDEATKDLGLEGEAVHLHALSAVLANVGLGYAAAALAQATHILSVSGELDENTAVTLDEMACAVDLEVAEVLHGVEADALPEVRVFHCADGWTMQGEIQGCTSNHFREQDGRPACEDAAVWKTVEHHDFGLTIGFYCDADLPEERRVLAAASRSEA